MPNETQQVGPPPVPEVSLRTLSSDAQSVARGLAVPEPQLVQPQRVSAPQVATVGTPKPQKKSSKKLIILISLLVVVAGAAGAFLFFKFGQGSTGPEATLEVQN
ncbi:MAG: hypothetical protein R3B52_01490 [Candidatus Paceibacterota bacterium]